MHVLVTGASGFLGRYVIAALVQSGHSVRAVSRRDLSAVQTAPSSMPNLTPNLKWVQADLTASGERLVPMLQGIDAVVHLAAAMSGDFETQQIATVLATEHLLEAMKQASVTRLVAISSFSVYDYRAIDEGDVLDETSPLETHLDQRDIYTQMKLSQEKLVRAFEATGGQVTVIRPGMIYDSQHLFNAFLGTGLPGNLWIRIGQSAQLPITYAANCADAISQSISNPQAIGQTLNVVDDHLPDQKAYASLVAKTQNKPMIPLVIPWRLMCFVSDTVWRCRQLLSLPVKLPGLLVPASLHARCKPLQYSNDKVKQVLQWEPTYGLKDAITLPPPQRLTQSED